MASLSASSVGPAAFRVQDNLGAAGPGLVVIPDAGQGDGSITSLGHHAAVQGLAVVLTWCWPSHQAGQPEPGG